MRYSIDRGNRFVEAMRGIAEYEIRPGNTVSFLSEVDLTAIEMLRKSGPKASYTAFVVKAVAGALREFPYANRRLCRRFWWPFSTCIQQFESCDISVAVERDVKGAESVTFVDVCREADKKGLGEITTWLSGLATCEVDSNEQWRIFFNTIRRLPRCVTRQLLRLPYYFPSMWAKYRGGATMVSSPAKYGVDVIVASWTAPLGVSFGLVKPRPWVRDGMVVAAPTFVLTLNFDRRVMAGAQAARFFSRIVKILEHADTEMAAPAPVPSGVTMAPAMVADGSGL